jgi:O-glycosyl hydrolase
MIRKVPHFMIFLLMQTFIYPQTFSQDLANKSSVHLRINGAERFQQLDGFGMNINTAWWYDGKYGDASVVQPAIDQLIDSLGVTIFRAVIEETDWEEINDNNDPDTFNWDYYNKVFSDARFKGVWNTLHYLNSRGITKGLILSFMGGPPAAKPLATPNPKRSWMGGTDYSINQSMEDEFVESIAALLYYARHTAKVQFTLVSPLNETEQVSDAKSTDHPDGVVEGPNMPDAVQIARVIKKLAKKLDVLGMSDIRFVAPDAAGDHLFATCMDEMVKDSYLMSKLACWGVHAYGNNAKNYRNIIGKAENPNKSFWVTETAGFGNMLGQLEDNAKAYIFWDGFDCVYQHARRNGYGDNAPNDWVFWQPDDGKPMLEYIPSTKSWTPRKQFFEFAQLYNFVRPGAMRIGSRDNDSSLIVHSFINLDGQLVVVGYNSGKDTININGTLDNLPSINTMKMICTSPKVTLHKYGDISVKNNKMDVIVSPNSIFTLTGYADASHAGSSGSKPEPENWYAGDMHIHRNCGDGTSILAESEFTKMMEPNDLAVISVLADMGDGEVQDSKTDLPKVNGSDAVQSRPGRIVHFDAEWHFDPAGTTFENKALGGHMVMLGLKEANTIWNESPYKILEWGKKQNAIMGFCHMQYLKDSIPATLDCCTPIDFPVEAALGTIDFLAEDVWLNDASVKAYYRLLNCGFRLGWAAGTDFPCNNSEPFGTLLTYVQVKNQPVTYTQWIDGIKNGRTVVSTNGHAEFLDLKVNGNATPGDEIKLEDKGKVDVEVKWTTISEATGRIELILNGKVIAKQNGSSIPGKPVILKASVPILQSSWICSRRMDDKGHRSHTSPVYITLKNAPIRASAEDAMYFIDWIDKTIANTSPGGPWNKYFTHDLDVVQNRYIQARAVYQEIAREAREMTTRK